MLLLLSTPVQQNILTSSFRVMSLHGLTLHTPLIHEPSQFTNNLHHFFLRMLSLTGLLQTSEFALSIVWVLSRAASNPFEVFKSKSSQMKTTRRLFDGLPSQLFFTT
jgi:hypothetical protein